MLSSSLFLPYLLFALIATAVAVRRAKTRSSKRWTTIGLLTFFAVLGHVEEILGRIQHRWLCHNEAGFWVYQPAKLPPELFDAAGKPKFMTERGPDEKMLAPYVVFDWKIERSDRQTFLIIDKLAYRASDPRTKEVLAENVTFLRWPSEFLPTLTHISAKACFSEDDEVQLWRGWRTELFGLK